ncbi:MAG TPA: hypothetical protein VIG06_16240 [Kofleriaceae bacterium]
MRIPSLLALLALSIAAACGGADSPTDTTTPAPSEEPVTEAPAEPAATPVAADPAAAPTEATPTDPAAAPAAITVAVQNLAKGQSGAGKKLAVTATSGTNQITVHLAGLTHYCSPAPTFTAAVEGEKLVLAVAKPDGAISRCFAPHDLDAVVSLPGRNNVRSVVVVGDAGKELGTATVTSGK